MSPQICKLQGVYTFIQALMSSGSLVVWSLFGGADRWKELELLK